MAKKKITISLDEKLIEQIRQISKDEQRNISQQIGKMLYDYINSNSQAPK